MTSLLPLIRFIVYAAIAYSIVPVGILYFSLPTEHSQGVFPYVRAVFAGSSCLALILFVFFSYAWRWIWRLFPFLNTVIFPDLNGNWDMTIYWNRGKQSGAASATAIVKQSFLTFSMEVHSEASDSLTLLAHPKKDPESGRPTLYYIYRVIPKRLDGKNDPPYHGTAMLSPSPMSHDSLQGNYFTDAKTQGHFQLKKCAVNSQKIAR